jgi:uncharacterized protein YukE
LGAVAFVIVDGFEAPVETLRAAGAASTAVADGLRGTDLASPATALAAALPGGDAQRAGDEAAAAWRSTIATLADGMAAHATALTDSAQAYAGVESAVAGSLAAS